MKARETKTEPTRSKFPGFRWLVSPWPEIDGPNGPVHWTAYTPPDEDGMSWEFEGVAVTRQEAKLAADNWIASMA